MMPNQKNIMLRFSFIILVMVLIGIAIICKAGVIMFAERQYWKDVADRFVKENVTVRPTRGNIISSDGQLMASSLPEYKIYMDFMINKRKGGSYNISKTQFFMQTLTQSAKGYMKYSLIKVPPFSNSTSKTEEKKRAAVGCSTPNAFLIYNIKKQNVCPYLT